MASFYCTISWHREGWYSDISAFPLTAHSGPHLVGPKMVVRDSCVLQAPNLAAAEEAAILHFLD